MDRFGVGKLQEYTNHKLQDLTGLSSLTSVGGELSISVNPNLDSLNGLEALTSVG